MNTGDMSTEYNTSPYLLDDAMGELGNDAMLKNNDKSHWAKKINVFRCPEDKGSYRLVTYKKNVANDDTVNGIGLFRSVIFNASSKIVCIAPTKSMSYDGFKEKLPDLSNLITEEFVDGTMINLFWDERTPQDHTPDKDIIGGGWRIATRKNLGAHSHFYRYTNYNVQRNFADMFWETFEASNIIVEKLDKTFCYSFVLRHPENRIVSYVSKPELYLTDVLHMETVSEMIPTTNSDDNAPPINIDTDENNTNKYTINTVNRSTYMNMPAFVGSSVKYPQVFMLDSYEQLEKKVNEHTPDGTLTKGYVLRCPLTNLRTKIVPEEYNFVKELRGNFADMRFLYLTLHKQDRVHEYLHYYPEQFDLFNEYTHLLQDYTHCMHSLYRDCYISKTKPLKEYPANFRTHMYKVHEIYKQFYFDNNRLRSIQYADVELYLKELDTPLLFNTMFVVK
jgi:hypothetical protein